MTAAPLLRVLEGTGYLLAGEPAPGVRVGADVRPPSRIRGFRADASWQGATGLRVYFKFAEQLPGTATISSWHRQVWNEGFAPLLWVVSPSRVDLYNGFGRPVSAEDAQAHRIRVFEGIDQRLTELDAFAGRMAMETGQFWLHSNQVTRRTGVDEQLLLDLAAVEHDLSEYLPRQAAQALIGRSIFTQYLIDRRIVTGARLAEVGGQPTLPEVLRDPASAQNLFQWLADVFNGDMFPLADPDGAISEPALVRIAEFLEAVDPKTGQTTFFPYQFDVIPVELISSIYEQFAHSIENGRKPGRRQENTANRAAAGYRGVHYTRLPVVSLILDEVLQNTSGDETVLDATCGSGVFLVEALRRLVRRKGGESPSRALIRSVLHNQIYGVDISESAVRVAAFSLYLAALELDPNPEPPEALRFEHLIGRTLLVKDAFELDHLPTGAQFLNENGTRRTFDVIVGNPPWTFRGRTGTAERRNRGQRVSHQQPRGEAFDFLLHASQFASSTTRYGMVLSAPPFFAASRTGSAAARSIVERLLPVTMVDLSNLTPWLFPNAKMPAMILLARHRPQRDGQITVVHVPWSPLAEKSHTFEIVPNDVSTLAAADWAADRGRLKATLHGRGRDLPLLDELRDRYSNISSWLTSAGAELRDGMILGTVQNRTGDASFLTGLELLDSRGLEPLRVPPKLPRFAESRAQWPRVREVYRAPILLIKEFFRLTPRPVAAVADRDLIFTDAYFGASLPPEELESARLITAILSSALSAWYFLLTAAEFGVWKRRLLMSDVAGLPLVDPHAALETERGRRLLEIERRFRRQGPTASDWEILDGAVFDLYELSSAERIVVRDGLMRAGWQWKPAREASVAPARVESDLMSYASVFSAAIDGWLQATGKRHIRAEIVDLPDDTTLRVIRFMLREGRQGPVVDIVPSDGPLSDVLKRIEERLAVRLGASLVGARELRVHGADEVVIIKPSSRRFWLPGVALSDADAVIGESFTVVSA